MNLPFRILLNRFTCFDMETCRTCNKTYAGADDGYDGECPDCADVSAVHNVFKFRCDETTFEVTVVGSCAFGTGSLIDTPPPDSIAGRSTRSQALRAASDALESLVVALACEGFDLDEPGFQRAVQQAVDSVVENLT